MSVIIARTGNLIVRDNRGCQVAVVQPDGLITFLSHEVTVWQISNAVRWHLNAGCTAHR